MDTRHFFWEIASVVPIPQHKESKKTPVTAQFPTSTASKPCQAPIVPKIDIKEDEYSKYVETKLQQNKDTSNKFLVKQEIGECIFCLMNPKIPYATEYEAISLLNGLAQDRCHVECGLNWTREHIKLMLERGPHHSVLVKKRPCANYAKKPTTR